MRIKHLMSETSGIEYDQVRKKRSVLSHFYYKTIILPRQARDKHRESTQKQMPFFAPCLQTSV